jgi:hypothetical protein
MLVSWLAAHNTIIRFPWNNHLEKFQAKMLAKFV